MAARTPTTERMSFSFPLFPFKSAVVGDSSIKYVHQHFCPGDQGAPAFISYSSSMYEDVPATLEYLPRGVETLIVHVGTMDVATKGCSASITALRHMLDRIRNLRPELRTIFLSLPLPRAPNRHRRGSNHRFVSWFNRELNRHNNTVRRLCYGRRLGPRVRFISHAFEELPLRRFLAYDGLHPSFEGVGLLAQHFRAPLRWRPPRWSRVIPASYGDGAAMGSGSNEAVAPPSLSPRGRTPSRRNNTSRTGDAVTSSGRPTHE